MNQPNKIKSSYMKVKSKFTGELGVILYFPADEEFFLFGSEEPFTQSEIEEEFEILEEINLETAQ